ncbi:MAG: DUF4105 domain-containing protein [Gammaproteobacteria bacterium]|nr:MAG: DUF4105 domain-containing protein [Gammaproteobacteria bacterium]
MSVNELLHYFAAVIATLAIAGIAGWGGLALWFKWSASRVSTVVSMALWSAFCIAVLVVLWRGHAPAALMTLAAGCAVFAQWWLRLHPSNDRIWNDDVACQLTGVVSGDAVTLRNLRDFEWRSRTDYTVRWHTRDYNLQRLRSLDMILSYWAGPAIAHTLVSFGFDDGEQVVFSVEIRRQKDALFSEVGGFFKLYELSIVAATERDVIRVRTNVRGEDDYLYRIRMPQQAMRELLVAYVEEANRLVDAPRFYNTITANCTTIIYYMVSHIVGRLPLSHRLLLSGYLPEYLYALGALDQRYPLNELRARGRLRDRALGADHSAAFSAEIRRGIPDLFATGDPST